MNLSQQLAELILSHATPPSNGSAPFVALNPVDNRMWIKALSSALASMQDNNYQPIILCPAEVRQLVKSSTEREIPKLVVISISEVISAGNSISLEVLGEIKQEVGDVVNA